MKSLVHKAGWRIILIPASRQEERFCEWLRNQLPTARWADEMALSGYRLDPDDVTHGLLEVAGRVHWGDVGAAS